MKKAMDAAFVGAGTGVVTTGALLVARVFLRTGRVDELMGVGILIATTLGGGLTFMLSAMLLSAWLLGRVERGRSPGSLLVLGLLAGPPVGVAACAFVMLLLFPILPAGLSWLADPDLLSILGAALAGGAGLGLSCAWMVSRPSKEAS